MQDLLSPGTGEVYTEKAEMIEAILAAGGSSHCTCAVCYEDYQNGDVMRVLFCFSLLFQSLYMLCKEMSSVVTRVLFCLQWSLVYQVLVNPAFSQNRSKTDEVKPEPSNVSPDL
jgi:hypothetical protein